MTFRDLRVVIVDDDPGFRIVLRHLIEDGTAYSVVGEAAHGAEALEAVKATEPDLVVMDIMMPVMDGIEAATRIRDEHPRVVVVALTASQDEAHEGNMMHAGAHSFIRKDQVYDRLLTVLDTIARG